MADNMGGQIFGGRFRKGQDPLQASGLANSERGGKDPEKGFHIAFD